MKLDNCINCCTHKDNKKTPCPYRRHKFSISERAAKDYNWTIDYIKKENAEGRHIVACLGSVGLTFIEAIKRLANYAYAIGDKDFYNLICPEKP